MLPVQIIVGSMLGASEYVADELAATLENAGYSATIHLQPDISDIPLEGLWIICTSTHGAGDLPDNIQPFSDQLTDQDLSAIKFSVVGLGDTSYDTFCYGAKQMQKQLSDNKAQLVREPVHIDVLEFPIPEEAAVEWLNHWIEENPDLV